MTLTGNVSSDVLHILECTELIRGCVSRKLSHIQDNLIREAAQSQFKYAGEIYDAIRLLVTNTASACSCFILMRTLFESMLSMMAFVKNTGEQAVAYQEYVSISDWKNLVLYNRYEDAPIGQSENVNTSLAEVEAFIRKNGKAYLTGKNRTDERIARVLRDRTFHSFRDTWYSEKPDDLLEEKDMLWMRSRLWTLFCPHVHASPAASCTYPTADKDGILIAVSGLLGISMYLLAESLISLSAPQKGTLRKVFNMFKYGTFTQT